MAVSFLEMEWIEFTIWDIDLVMKRFGISSVIVKVCDAVRVAASFPFIVSFIVVCAVTYPADTYPEEM